MEWRNDSVLSKVPQSTWFNDAEIYRFCIISHDGYSCFTEVRVLRDRVFSKQLTWIDIVDMLSNTERYNIEILKRMKVLSY